jgi:hypothetical protein
MKNRQGTEGAPCYFSALDTLVTPIDEVTLRLQAPYPFCGPEGSFGSELTGSPLPPGGVPRPMEKGAGKGFNGGVEPLVEPGKLYKGQGIQGRIFISNEGKINMVKVNFS